MGSPQISLTQDLARQTQVQLDEAPFPFLAVRLQRPHLAHAVVHHEFSRVLAVTVSWRLVAELKPLAIETHMRVLGFSLEQFFEEAQDWHAAVSRFRKVL